MTEQARLYGTVLYELKVPEKMVRETGRIFQENPELKAVLDDPTLQETKKEAIIGKIWKEPDFSSTMVHFLKKACEEGCIGQMEDMIKVWEKCLLDGAGILSASLFYVTRPDEEQLAGIREFLCREYKKKDVQLEMAAAPELMGGFVLKTSLSKEFQPQYTPSAPGEQPESAAGSNFFRKTKIWACIWPRAVI